MQDNMNTYECCAPTVVPWWQGTKTARLWFGVLWLTRLFQAILIKEYKTISIDERVLQNALGMVPVCVTVSVFHTGGSSRTSQR